MVVAKSVLIQVAKRLPVVELSSVLRMEVVYDANWLAAIALPLENCSFAEPMAGALDPRLRPPRTMESLPSPPLLLHKTCRLKCLDKTYKHAHICEIMFPKCSHFICIGVKET